MGFNQSFTDVSHRLKRPSFHGPGLKSKEGRLRGTLMGKRVPWSMEKIVAFVAVELSSDALNLKWYTWIIMDNWENIVETFNDYIYIVKYSYHLKNGTHG